VSAGIVAINFPGDLADQTCHISCFNTTADGFRISPSRHYDTFVLQGPTSAPGIGWDSEPGGGSKPNYLGPPFPPPFTSFVGSGLYIDHNGSSFGLLSLESLGQSFLAESSNGAIVTIPNNPSQFPNPTPPLHFDFVGPEWRDIQWVLFFYGDVGEPTAGFNQLAASVPGPPTFGLFGLGILLLGWCLRSSKRHV